MSPTGINLIGLVGVALLLPQQTRREEMGAKTARADRHGDPLPPGAVTRLGTSRLRHPYEVTDVAFSPDGKAVAACGWYDRARLWDVGTGRLVRLFGPSWGLTSRVAFSPDGKTLAALADGGPPAVRLWDVRTGTLLHEWALPQGAGRVLAFSPDGKLLACGGQAGKILLRDAATGKVVQRLDCGVSGAEELHFCPGGRLLVTDGRYDVRLWDPATRKAVWVRDGTEAQAHSIHGSPDGKALAVGEDGGAVRLYEAATGKELCRLQGRGDGPVFCVRFSPDARTLAATEGDGGVALWDLATGRPRSRLEGHHDLATSLAFSPDGKRLATAGRDTTVRLWDAATGRELSPADRHCAIVNAVALSPDGKVVATAGWDRVARLWDLASGRPVGLLRGHRGRVGFVQGSADGRYFVSAGLDDHVRVWDAATREEVRRLEGELGRVCSLALSPDGKTVAAATFQSRVRLWDLATGKAGRGIETPFVKVSRIAFSPDGRTLAVADQNRIDLWELPGGRWLRRAEQDGEAYVSGVMAFSPDGRTLASVWGDGTVRLTEVASGKRRLLIKGGKAKSFCVAFAAGGRLLLAGGAGGAVRLWDARTGEPLSRLEGYSGDVWCLAVSADDRVLVTGHEDSTALVWDVRDRLRPGPVAKEELTPRRAEELWQALGGEDAEKAYEAVWALSASPEPAAALLRVRLRPDRHPAEDGRVAKLVADLRDSRFRVREAAARELDRLGSRAEPELHRVLECAPPLELRRRVEAILAKPRAWVPVREPLRELRAIEALERAGAPEARRVLQRLTTGAADSRVTQGAGAALQRLKRRLEAP